MIFQIAFLLASLPSLAATTLGIPDGIYDGGGPLKTEIGLVPTLSFTSHRIIHNGTIEAHSTAYLLGFKVVSVDARLKVQELDDKQHFTMLDLDQDNKKVGDASCDDKSCSFSATVLNGSFLLSETWTLTEHGFSLSKGFQNFKGTPAFYEGDFFEQAASFNRVSEVVFKSPLKTPPDWQGIGPAQVLDAFFFRSGEIVDRSHATFDNSTNFRPERVKLLHPLGVCAQAEWHITKKSRATGLFSEGTKVPAIVRFSSGTSDSVYLAKGPGRIFGLAVKLFPTRNLNQAVETVNIQMLDKYGFDRTSRKRYFHEDDSAGATPVYFTNVAPAQSAFGKALATFFDRFDKPNFSRPVYPVAQVDQEGRLVKNDIAPYEIRFVPHFAPHAEVASTETLDFRTELLEYKSREVLLDIVLQSYEPSGDSSALKTVGEVIGQLKIDRMVMSNDCDLTLHFNHPLNRIKEVLH